MEKSLAGFYLMLDKSFRIVFVLLARFPTERAYGVTTEYSAIAAQNLGYDVQIVTPKTDSLIKSKVKVQLVGSKLYEILLTNSVIKMLTLRFSMFSLFYACLIRKKYSDQINVFWSRDIVFSFLLSVFSKNLIICEIHQVPTTFQKIVLRLCMLKFNILLAPISDFLMEKELRHSRRYILAPMGINANELLKYSGNKIEEKKIVYLGNAKNGNVALDCNFINEVAIRLQKEYPKWSIEIIGISRDYFSQRIVNPLSSNINLLGQISRENALEKIWTASIGLVIYPNDKHFWAGFPIKIVEYAALKVAIVASDTIAHRRILDSNRCIFYQAENIASIVESIGKIIGNSTLKSSLVKSSRLWSEKYTYESRVENILLVITRSVNQKI